jgi:hypothetical protein
MVVDFMDFVAMAMAFVTLRDVQGRCGPEDPAEPPEPGDSLRDNRVRDKDKPIRDNLLILSMFLA